MRKIILLIITVLISIIILPDLAAQTEKKQARALRISTPIKVDGNLDEAIWEQAIPAKDFIQYSPYNGVDPSFQTSVKILYNNYAIYFGARMYDPAPDSILRQLGTRDNENLNADNISIIILPYNDGQNAFEFIVTASGVQLDIKHAPDFSDEIWDAVWKSKVQVTDEGWVAEFEIPYSAIRFPKVEEQTWGLQIGRNIRRYRELSTWNFVDNKIEDWLSMSGELTDLNDIKPPLRLFFIPYVAAYTEKQSTSDSWGYFYNYGMDLKLGLNESYTLDMTLIPDFGQVQSDDVIVNLSPFEVYYEERRPFFTESTELFEKGNIFYSRRIGRLPSGFGNIEDQYDDEDIIENPDAAQLINATKISGRNKNGLAIGVLNAITSNTHAKVRDSLGNESRILTEPATNYNMLVFDQTLKNNSFISFYNTNVYRGSDHSVPNVTGTEFRITDKRNMFSGQGIINLSQKYNRDTSNDFGYKYFVEFGKISGNFRFEAYQNAESDIYDPNDLGFNRRNNDFENGVDIEYNIYDPFWKINEWHNEISLELSHLYTPRVFTTFHIGGRSRLTTKRFMTFGLFGNVSPTENHDYYEPRVWGRVLKKPPNWNIITFFSPDYRKKFVIDFRLGYWETTRENQYSYWGGIEPRMRFNDHFFLTWELEYDFEGNDLGYVLDSTDDKGNDVIILGSRDITNITNTIFARYVFTPLISLELRLRHYWFTVKYSDYHDLNEDGYWTKNDYQGEHDFSFNAFNVDMVFNWEFAPASQLLFVWKNSIYSDKDEIPPNFFDNAKDIFLSPSTNSFSIKLLYYLDYQYLKKKKPK